MTRTLKVAPMVDIPLHDNLSRISASPTHKSSAGGRRSSRVSEFVASIPPSPTPVLRTQLPPTAYFRDETRRIDFVLAFKPASGGKKHKQEHNVLRAKFEDELKKRGCELEYEGKEQSQDGKTAFVKLHATWAALARQAELEGLQMPFQPSDLEPKAPSVLSRVLTAACSPNHPFTLPEELRIPRKEMFTDAFHRDKESKFLIESKDTFFSSAQRVYLTWSIISSTSITVELTKKSKKNEVNGVGPAVSTSTKTTNIVFMLRDGDEEAKPKSCSVYSDAFPLHDGEWGEDAENVLEGEGRAREGGEEGEGSAGVGVEAWPLRRYLYHSWARPCRWKSAQPLDQIRDYYGEQVGMYFAWLGFYTKMLIFPSIVGLIVFLCGLISFSIDESAKEICEKDSSAAGMTVCRSCPGTNCPYTKLGSTCGHQRLSGIFENGGATFFSLFMAVWAMVFLEFWKRYQAEVCARWDVSDGELGDENVRPDYQLSVHTTQRNPITGQVEPYLPKKDKMKRVGYSILSVFFSVLVVLGLLSSVMIYKTAGNFLWHKALKTESGKYKASPALVTSLTASILNGLFIAVMTKVFMAISWKMTVAEMPRTESTFEESYTYKVFLFQFVNFYGALFYLAFIRGQFVPSPDEQSQFDDRCPPSGCLLDVTIQLFVIFTGKQAINNFLELGLPLIKNWWAKRGNKESTASNAYTRWEKDFDLQQPGPLPLFGDYLEMIIQYGFVTMFVTAFPLAPLFALANNVIEIRLDAFKALTQTRRYIPIRAKDIGPWYDLMVFITKMAILTNAVVIAFTTNFVDKLVYYTFYEGEGSFVANNATSFIEFSFSKFETQDWCHMAGNESGMERWETSLGESCEEIRDNVSVCYFKDYRLKFPDGTYRRTAVWWHVMVGKLAFVIIFEHFIILLQSLLQYLIPDVPEHVSIRLARETYLQREAFLDSEFGEKEDEKKTLTAVIEESESEDEDPWDPQALADSLPPEVTVNQVGGPSGSVRPKQPFLFVLGRKLMLC